MFSDVLLYIPALDLYLNDTSQYAVPGTLRAVDKAAFSLQQSRLTALRTNLKYESRLKRHIRLDIQGDGSARLTVTEKNYGTYFETANRRFAEFTPELRQRYFTSLAADLGGKISGSPVTDFRDYPGVVRYTVFCEDFAAKVGGFLTFDLPGANRFSQAVGRVEKNRSTPWQRNHSTQIEVEYEITFPENFQVAGGPSAKMRLGDHTIGYFTRNDTLSPGKLIISCKLKVPAGIIPAADCDKLFLLNHQLARPEMGKIVLMPKGGEKK